MLLHNIEDKFPCHKQKMQHFNFRSLKEKQTQSKEKKNVSTNEKSFLNLFLIIIFYFRYHLKNIT